MKMVESVHSKSVITMASQVHHWQNISLKVDDSRPTWPRFCRAERLRNLPLSTVTLSTLVISLHYHAFFSWTMHTLHHIKDRSQLFLPRCSIIVWPTFYPPVKLEAIASIDSCFLFFFCSLIILCINSCYRIPRFNFDMSDGLPVLDE